MGKNKKNYNNMYDSTNFEIPEEVLMETVEETESEATEVEEVVTKEAEEEIVVDKIEAVKGKIIKCSKLNIRNKPSKEDSEVVCTLTFGSILEVYNPETEDGWYDVKTSNGKRGFCMKDYIELI